MAKEIKYGSPCGIRVRCQSAERYGESNPGTQRKECGIG